MVEQPTRRRDLVDPALVAKLDAELPDPTPEQLARVAKILSAAAARRSAAA